MSARLRNGYAHECPYPGQKLSKHKTSPRVHHNKTKTRRMLPEGGQIQFLVSSLNSFHSQDQKLGDWCWVMKSTSSAISSFLTLGRISLADWHEHIPSNTSCMNMPTRNEYRPKVHTDQVFIIQRKRTRSHELTIVSPCPKPLERTWRPTFTHDSVVGDLWRSVITRKWGAWRILRKRGMNAYKRPRNRWKKGDENWEKMGNSTKLISEILISESLIHFVLRILQLICTTQIIQFSCKQLVLT